MKITDKVSDERLREMFGGACEMHEAEPHDATKWVEIASVCNELLSARTTIALQAASLKQQDAHIAELEAVVASLMGEHAEDVDRCPVCSEPCHATEGDEEGRHPDCAVRDAEQRAERGAQASLDRIARIRRGEP